MNRIPAPRMSLLMLALGGLLVLGQQVSGVPLDSAPATVLTVPDANVAPSGSGIVSVADMRVDDAAAPLLR